MGSGLDYMSLEMGVLFSEVPDDYQRFNNSSGSGCFGPKLKLVIFKRIPIFFSILYQARAKRVHGPFVRYNNEQQESRKIIAHTIHMPRTADQSHDKLLQHILAIGHRQSLSKCCDKFVTNLGFPTRFACDNPHIPIFHHKS